MDKKKPASGHREIIVGDALVKRVADGSNANWLLIPGGPCMGAEYLRRMFLDIGLNGSIWTFELRDPAGRRSDADVVAGWRDSLRAAILRLGKPVVVGHSFGGMLALSTPRLERRCAALVLMDSAPDRTWVRHAERAVRRNPIPAAARSEKAFNDNPSAATFRRMFVAWAPYYFPPKRLEAGRRLLRRNSYFPEVYRIGQRHFLDRYARRCDVSRLPVYCIAGDRDQITPLSLFRKDAAFRAKGNVEFIPIPGGGHFPWVENFTATKEALKHIENRMNGGTKT